MNNNGFNDLARLNFEDFIWSIFIIIAILNISGDYCEKEYIIYHDYSYKDRASDIFTITVIITLFIYIYFFARNYHDYMNCPMNEKNLFLIRLLGSSFLISGALVYCIFNLLLKIIFNYLS